MPARPTSEVLNRVRNDAFGRLSFRQRETTNLHLDERIYDRGETIGPRRQKIVAEHSSILVFADDQPRANFAHACRYLLYDATNGELHREVPAQFPPWGAQRPETLHPFHEPVRFTDSLIIHRIWPWFRCPVIVPAYQRFAVLYSGMSNKRHLNELEFLYRTLIDIYHFDPNNILVYTYDGTLNTQDGVQSKWPGDNTNYRIQINGSGTQAAFESGIDSLKSKLKANDLLLIHTNNHGGYDNTPGTANLCTYPNWDAYYANDFANKLAELPKFGKLIVMMEQCHSGGFNQPIINMSPATATSVASACLESLSSYVSADGNWDPFARDWIAAQAGLDAFGAALAFNADSNGDGKIQAQEAFDYANAIKLAADSPIFNESSAAGGDITLGQQYRIWWWWCFLLRLHLEPSLRRLSPQEFKTRFDSIQPQLMKLAAALEEKSDGLRKEFEGELTSILASKFDLK